MKTAPGTQARQHGGRGAVMRTVALFAVSMAFAMVMGELFARAFVPVRNVGPTFSEYDPLYGKRLKKSFSCVRTATEFSMRFSTNSLGFRGSEPKTFPVNGVLFLGDSFTSGYGVNDGEEFPALIAHELSGGSGSDGVPVVNAGTGNTGNGYWLRFLHKDLDVYAPRAIVFAFCTNDFLDNAVERFYTVDQRGGLQESGIPPRQELARGAQSLIEAVPGLAYSHLVGFVRQLFSESGETPSGFGEGYADTLTYAILDQVFAYTEKRGLRTILLQIEVDTLRAARIDEIARKHGAAIIHAPSSIEHAGFYYKVDGHWNAAGHRVVASELLPMIRTALSHDRKEEPSQ
jgi:lysophospholipase L1-like esterase